VLQERLRLKREDTLFVLRKRFPGAIPEDYLDLIAKQESVQVLQTWFKSAIDAASSEAFIAVMRR